MTDDVASAPAADASPGAQIRVFAQYVKDFSFENPEAPNSLRGGQPSPGIELAIDVQGRRVDDQAFEVVLHIEAKAAREDKVSFLVELKYAGLFGFANLPPEALEPMLLIECPRLLFPFARRVLADATREGGFPPLYIDPIDFGALYMAQRHQHQHGGGELASNGAKKA